MVSLCLDYNPGDLVEWRPDPRTPWRSAHIVEVEHQGDRAGMFTVITVELYDDHGATTLGRRVVAGSVLTSCLRRPGSPVGGVRAGLLA